MRDRSDKHRYRAGIGVFRALTDVITPDIYQPTNGHALYVFELPDQQ